MVRKGVEMAGFTFSFLFFDNDDVDYDVFNELIFVLNRAKKIFFAYN